jgi:hypothetical protein
MSWTKRINSRNYTLGTLINIGFALYAGYPSFVEAWWLSFVVISAVLNHYFTVKAFGTMIDNRINSNSSTRGSRLFFYFLFKTLFLAAGFICLMVFAGNKVLQGLLIYIFQLIILALSIKNIGKFIKKGSST